MAKAFPTHGKYKIYCDGRLLVSEVVGPWNIEFIREWSIASIPLCEELKAKAPWIAVAMISGSMLATPEAMDALHKVIRNSVQHRAVLPTFWSQAPMARDVASSNGLFRKPMMV